MSLFAQFYTLNPDNSRNVIFELSGCHELNNFLLGQDPDTFNGEYSNLISHAEHCAIYRRGWGEFTLQIKIEHIQGMRFLFNIMALEEEQIESRLLHSGKEKEMYLDFRIAGLRKIEDAFFSGTPLYYSSE